MATKGQLGTIYTVREDSVNGPIVARFVYSTDAQTFAERATEREPGRTLVVEDRRGYVLLHYSDGFTTDL